MTASMLNGDDDVVGSLTSGGTESILMAMKAYRDRAAKLFPHITTPNMVRKLYESKKCRRSTLSHCNVITLYYKIH